MANEPEEVKLNHLEVDIAQAIDDQLDASNRFDAAWKEVFAIFDRVVGAGNPARFVCNDGFVLARQVPKPEPTINVDKLKQLIEERYPAAVAVRLWNAITEPQRVVNFAKLTKVVEAGRIDPEVVLAATSTRKVSPTRNRRPWTTEDKKAIETGETEVEGVA